MPNQVQEGNTRVTLGHNAQAEAGFYEWGYTPDPSRAGAHDDHNFRFPVPVDAMLYQGYAMGNQLPSTGLAKGLRPFMIMTAKNQVQLSSSNYPPMSQGAITRFLSRLSAAWRAANG